MRDEQLKAIREKCIAANPEIERRTVTVLSEDEKDFREAADETIRLADVLLAILKLSHHSVLMGLYYGDEPHVEIVAEDDSELSGNWALRAADLDQQSDECIDFIHSLLCV